MIHSITIRSFGNHAILLEWPQSISMALSREILSTKDHLQKHWSGFDDMVEAYNSLTIFLIPGVKVEHKISELKMMFESRKWWKPLTSKSQNWCLPVCYDTQVALDLESLAENKSLSVDELVEIHTGAAYHVCFLGFLPGFAYLSGLDERLHTPRLSTPRLQIPAGSVSIGGAQTGVYPQSSPGGWHIIGRTPIQMFDANEGEWLKSGDSLQFFPVSYSEFKELQTAVAAGELNRKELLHD